MKIYFKCKHTQMIPISLFLFSKYFEQKARFGTKGKVKRRFMTLLLKAVFSFPHEFFPVPITVYA